MDQKSRNDLESLSILLDLPHLTEFAEFCGHKVKEKTKTEIVSLLLKTKRSTVENFFDNLEKLRGCSKTKILTEIYRFSPALGQELEAQIKLTKPMIVLSLMKAGYESKLEAMAALTKMTRSISHFPRKVIGGFRSDYSNHTKIRSELHSGVEQLNSITPQKIELEEFLYVESEQKAIVIFRQELGKRIYRQLSLRGQRQVVAYPTRLRIIDFDLKKGEILSNLAENDIMFRCALEVMTRGCTGSLKAIDFIQPASPEELKNILAGKIETRKQTLMTNPDHPQNKKEMEVLNRLGAFKRTRIQLKNAPLPGSPKNIIVDGADADETITALGVDAQLFSNLAKQSDYEFAIEYNGSKVTVTPKSLIIREGKNKLSQLEINILTEVLRQ